MERPARTDGPHRPRYHVTPPANWQNDPNGLVEVAGVYHLFYQHNPEAPEWGNICWGHAASADLARFADRPLALEPEDGLDGEGCFSGCVVEDGGTAHALYTACEDGAQRQALATCEDRDLRTWEKQGVVIADPPEGVPTDDFRDPYAYRADGAWELLVGATDGDPLVLRYRSPDLREWSSEGVFHREPARSNVWECPTLLRFDGGDVLLGSVNDRRTVEYRVGDRTEGFADGGAGGGPRLDYGDVYAPQGFHDESGRALLFGWIEDGRVDPDEWAGATTAPRVVTLRDGDLWQAPAPELGALRGPHSRHEATVTGATDLDVAGKHLELVAAFEGDADEVGLAVRRGGDGRVEVVVDRAAGELRVDRTPVPPAGERTHRGPAPGGDRTALRLFVDACVVEAFADGRATATTTVYPDGEHRGVAALARGGSAEATVDVWPMGSVWD